jgi:hypothetical protein
MADWAMKRLDEWNGARYIAFYTKDVAAGVQSLIWRRHEANATFRKAVEHTGELHDIIEQFSRENICASAATYYSEYYGPREELLLLQTQEYADDTDVDDEHISRHRAVYDWTVAMKSFVDQVREGAPAVASDAIDAYFLETFRTIQEYVSLQREATLATHALLREKLPKRASVHTTEMGKMFVGVLPSVLRPVFSGLYQPK